MTPLHNNHQPYCRLIYDCFHENFEFDVSNSLGTIHKVRALYRGGRRSRPKRIPIIFMTSFYCLKAYKGGGGVWKSPNLSVRTLCMVPYEINRRNQHSNKKK